MNPYPALTDALQAEWRADQERGHMPGTLIASNGSLVCVTDYELCTAMAKEIVRAL